MTPNMNMELFENKNRSSQYNRESLNLKNDMLDSLPMMGSFNLANNNASGLNGGTINTVIHNYNTNQMDER